ncbi:hypothetical protein IB642_04575 [Allofrancisella guangzhouensis]|uniref:Uncharacterized protein n=1 Tax=Allofrancisella guangzhouensis TaxID=594679 RepID=A0A0A8E2X2_9GAMM|nr:hypothetical protein [Allofrancisella guangzhouensis]AJC48358.1 hypothetical protein SD28_01120 [Allofrancisella guangzhouensis]MBK2026548.1 hypothetical protein [Allofrancisella guangzhouensis]MBK2044292.1 hypothetical protein [Allofrancisella guangzhouensis]MBK2045535.1 hypothetical protein [Allofrancisella guangzhouensis]
MLYLKQDCSLTLQECLEKYNKNYPFLNANNGHDEASKWFRNHDITHVIFGTKPFQIRGEAINDIWTLIGSNVTFKGYKEFFKFVDYKTVINSYLKKYKYKFIVYLVTLGYIPICVLAAFRAFKMTKKWDWYNYDNYLNTPVKDIRKEFNIKVIKP